jgi:F420H(2)-dependent quinone reductase
MASTARRLRGAIERGGMTLHGHLYRHSRGWVGHRIPGGPRTLMLEHRGRKSGKLRRTPLLYLGDGEDLVIVASKGGSPTHPAWWLNLREMPETTVWLGRERRRVVPREAGGSERNRLWRRLVELWPDYERYQRRTDREIPVVILSRVGS